MDERRMNQDGAVAGVNGDEFQPYECFQAAGGGVGSLSGDLWSLLSDLLPIAPTSGANKHVLFICLCAKRERLSVLQKFSTAHTASRTV